MRRTYPRRPGAARGQVLPLYAALLGLGFALAVGLFDLGTIALKRQELVQVAALAARAGADRYAAEHWEREDAVALEADAARATALAVAALQTQALAGPHPPVVEAIEVDPAGRSVAVTVAAAWAGLWPSLGGPRLLRTTERAAIGLTR